MNLFLTYASGDDNLKFEGAFSCFGLEHSPYDLLFHYSGELEELARQCGMRPFSEFTAIDADPEDDEQWFEANDGIKTVSALIQQLPETERYDVDELLLELRRLLQELEILQATGRRFVFGVG